MAPLTNTSASVFDTANEAYGYIDAVRTLSPGRAYEEAVTELADAAEEMADAITADKPTSERLREVLRDQNGLPPTWEAMAVIKTVLDAIDTTDQRMTEQLKAADYAARVIDALKRVAG